MSYIFDRDNQSGVLFFFHKCGTTMVRDTMKNNDVDYVYKEKNPICAIKPLYYDYKKNYERQEQAWLLVRNPIERFLSGYWHYWRQWKTAYNEITHWVPQRLNRPIEKYTMDVHLDLIRYFEYKKGVIEHQHDFDFWVHCMHDLADEYVTDMKVVKLGTVPDDEFLKKLLSKKVYNAKYSLSNSYDYPELRLTRSEKKYINNRYRRAMNLFGYGNDY